MGIYYNVMSKNCHHFTIEFCKKLMKEHMDRHIKSDEDSAKYKKIASRISIDGYTLENYDHNGTIYWLAPSGERHTVAIKDVRDIRDMQDPGKNFVYWEIFNLSGKQVGSGKYPLMDIRERINEPYEALAEYCDGLKEGLNND